MKTPISYYGGKQMLASKIINLLPEHKMYCEPFVGGGAIFFAKKPSEIEVINDIDGRVVTFFKTCKSNFDALKMLILQTPHSREIHRDADYVLKNQYLFSELKIAWAFWVQTNMSFGCSIGAGFGYGKKKASSEKKTMNKRNGFTEEYAQRLECVQIEQNDAIRVIESRDTENTLFYLDPPYYNSDMGHYSFYTESDYTKLLETISGIEGKFLMSSYPSEHLSKFTKKNKWDTINIEMTIPMSSNSKKKTEVLTANYNLN